MSKVTIYHNPRCSKSRQTLALLEERGIAPEVVRYLDSPPDISTLRQLLQALGMRPRELLRKGEDAYKSLGLADTSLTDEALLEAMVSQP
ncbi:MAG: arsenate reductase (glutaredoxin), partial [Halieaceae bacterium]|nr:arsenate reductase (glutaredoxin) [Halieaceae bacterium]